MTTEEFTKSKAIVSFAQKPHLIKNFFSELFWGVISTCIAIYSATHYSRVGFLIGVIGAFVSFRQLYREWKENFIQSLVLKPSNLQLAIGSSSKIQHIPLSEIDFLQLNYFAEYRTWINQKAGEESFQHLLQQLQSDKRSSISADAYLHLKNGKSIPLRIEYFPNKDTFCQLVEYLHNYLSSRNKNRDLQEKGKGVPPLIWELMWENQQLLQADFTLKQQFEQVLLQAYESIYTPRTGFEPIPMADKTPIAEFTDAQDRKIYFFSHDYKPGVEAEEIQVGENLIRAAKDNLSLIQIRIESYQSIAQKLEKLVQKEALRKQLSQIAENIDQLQQKNTQRALEENLTSLQSEAELFDQLSKLHQQIAETDTLEKSIFLKEHIQLFKSEILPHSR
ncbi:MAG: hypothetical protein RMJ44_01230 [Cytophagales bacterium]|nr:hypothetical protein [Cytophagales bacterium]